MTEDAAQEIINKLDDINSAINSLTEVLRDAFTGEYNGLDRIEEAIGGHAHLMADKIDEIKGNM